MQNIRAQLLAVTIATTLLGGILADRLLFHLPPENTDWYHQQVREAAAALPRQFGSWVGEDVPLPRSAITLLKPNALFSRRYHEPGPGRSVSFMLVQCRDARDLQGHWPPVCYEGQGWVLSSARPKTWEVNGLSVEGMQYDFVCDRLDRPSRLAVDDFMVLPDGRTCPDMQGVQAVAKDPRRRLFGAAQVQVVTDGTLPPDERERLTQTMIQAHQPLINAVLQGAKP